MPHLPFSLDDVVINPPKKKHKLIPPEVEKIFLEPSSITPCKKHKKGNDTPTIHFAPDTEVYKFDSDTDPFDEKWTTAGQLFDDDCIESISESGSVFSLEDCESMRRKSIDRYKFILPSRRTLRHPRKGRKVPSSLERESSSTSMQVAWVYASSCCITKYAQFKVKDCKKRFCDSRLNFLVKTVNDRGQFVLDSLYDMESLDEGRFHSWNHCKLCSDCFCDVYAVPRRLYLACEKKYLKGETFYQDFRAGRETPRPKGDILSAWLGTYFSEVGDPHPETGDVLLPFMRKKEIYQEFSTDFLLEYPERTAKVPDRSYFSRIWSEQFPHVKISEYKPLSGCKICSELRTALRNCKSLEERTALKLRRKNHLDEVRVERRAYHKTRAEASKPGSNVISIIIDAMDQSKTDIMKTASKIPGDENYPRLRTAVLGVKVHGKEQSNYVYLSHPDIPHGANFCLQGLYSTLEKVGFDNLPDTLRLQLDNTVKDNKNKHVFTSLALLVKTGVFKEIYVSFLPVGHTHEDIDQLFSRISAMLKGKPVGSVAELIRLIKKCVTPSPDVSMMSECIAFDEFVAPVVVECPGISTPHAFYFSYCPEKKTTLLRYKEWTTHPDWLPTQGFQTISGIPRGKPHFVSKRNIDCDKILDGAASLKQRVPSDQYEHFVHYVQELRDQQRSKCQECTRLRHIEQSNPYQNKKLSKEERRARRVRYVTAQADLAQHRASGTCPDHRVVDNWKIPQESVEVDSQSPAPLVQDAAQDEAQDYTVLWEALEDALPLVYQGRKPRKSAIDPVSKQTRPPRRRGHDDFDWSG